MGHSRIFFRVIFKAFWVQPGRLMASLAALTVGATLSGAFLFLYFELPRKMTGEFRSLGPNLVLAPKTDMETFPEPVAAQLSTPGLQASWAPWLYAAGKVSGEEVVFAGTDLGQAASVNPGWQVFARRESKASANLQSFLARGQEARRAGPDGWLLAGEKTAAHFGWHGGETVRLEYGARTLELPLFGILSTGTSEDSQLLLSIRGLQLLTAREGRLSLIQLAVAGPASQVESVRQQLANKLPDLEVRPIRQVVESEAHVVMKVRGLMFGLTAIVLAIVILTVMTRVSGLVFDRRREIGLMKALGGSDGAISLLFVAETTCLAVLAAAAGTVLGFVLSQWAVHRIFHSALAWRWDVLPVVIAVTLFVTFAACIFPIQLVRRLEPAVILKGN